MYHRILAGLDGSMPSNYGAHIALALAERGEGCELIGCHVYAARMHRARFEEMEPNLPPNYQTEEKLGYLRGVHDGIISGGMKLISTSYLKDLETEASRRGQRFRIETPEGRNYVEMIKLARGVGADLIVLGATGQGAVPETSLGSVSERVLLERGIGDIMIVRKPWTNRGPIVVGIDGSEESFQALSRGLELASSLHAPVTAAAIYDPFFHSGVFNSISGVLTEEGKQHFNFAAQEKLHDEIIDRGLEAIYRSGLDRASKMARDSGVELTTTVLMGKVFSQLYHFADVAGARLVVVGRWGLHREEDSLIGSNAFNLVRIAHTNVLVVNPPPPDNSPVEQAPLTMSLETAGSDDKSKASTPSDIPAAELIVLRKTKLFAPEFHRHIVKGRLEGQVIRKGDKALVYEVEATVPEGTVKVTPSTRLEFK